MVYPGLKALHIFFVVCWYAGLFYLPRLFVNLAMADPGSKEYETLLRMSRKLLRFMTPLGALALLFGIVESLYMGYLTSGTYWVHVKYLIGIFLAAYHAECFVIQRRFEQRLNGKSHKFYRVFNELPVFVLALAVVLAIFKPF